MKKPLSVLLILVLLLSLAPLTLASEEAAGESAEAPAEEPIGDVPETEPVPAPDGAETFDAWLEDGLLNWKSYTGATIYVVHYRLPTGQNARFELTDADKPFDFAAGLDKFDHPSGTYDIYLRAGYRRSNGEFIGLANSDHLYIDYTI